MRIIVDTREQKPLSFGRVTKKALTVGDYTTEKLLNVFHVERKSLQDLYSTIIHNHPRFRREIIRAEEKGIELIVVVEGTFKDFINKKFPGGSARKAPSETLKKIIHTIWTRYDLKIIFCKDRTSAKAKIESLFRTAEKKIKTLKHEEPT